MLRYGFFDSEITGFDEQGMPIFDRAESSDFLAMFISHIISDGVLGQPGDCFQVLAGEGMKLRVSPGFAVIQGRFAVDWNVSTITIPTAPTSHKRMDRVVLRANYHQRLCELVVKEGVPAAVPVPPELLQPESGDYYELCLATVLVGQNQGVITQANITDTRYDSRVCGVVTQVIDHLDTSVFFAQLDQFYREFVAKSDASYAQFVIDMQTCIDALQASGDAQLLKLNGEFVAWFDSVKNQVTGDMAVRIQKQLDDHKADADVHTTSGKGHPGQVWKTDGEGIPGWRDDEDTTYTVMKGASQSTAGSAGLVPEPPAGSESNKYLGADGTWTIPPDTNNAVTQTSSNTTNADYRVLLSGTADDTTRTEGVRKDKDLKYNPSTNTLTTGKVNADTADSTVTFSSGDADNPTGWADVGVIASGEKHSSLLRKFSLAVKNVRYLYHLLTSGALSTLLGTNLTASRAVVANGNGKLATAGVTSTELGYLAGAKSKVQDQLDALNTHLQAIGSWEDITGSCNLGYVPDSWGNVYKNIKLRMVVFYIGANSVNNQSPILGIGQLPGDATVKVIGIASCSTSGVSVDIKNDRYIVRSSHSQDRPISDPRYLGIALF